MKLKGKERISLVEKDLFVGFSEDEISLNKGIWVNVLQKKSDGWWLVQYDKQRGWFPSNYLIEVRRKRPVGLEMTFLFSEKFG